MQKLEGNITGNNSILVAEDDADDRFLLSTAFKENNLDTQIHFVENGVEILDYLLACNCPAEYPKLILLDLNMPKKDGREVLYELKQRPEFISIPIVIFSTTDNEMEMKNCYALGADSYIVKPDNYQKLLNIVSDIHTEWLVSSAV